MAGPLSGIRILDFSRAVAGPYGTLLLADLGADVIKIDQVPSEMKTQAATEDADWATLFGYPVSEEGRNTPTGRQRWGQSMGHFQSLNRNKRRVAINLSAAEGRKIFHELVKKSDVVYDNFRPAIVRKLQIDFDTLKHVNPRIVCCSLSGFGSTGSWADAPAYDVVLQALGGEMSMTGMPGAAPCRSGIPIADVVGGAFATLGVLCALQARDRTGMGQAVDLSMLDVQLSLQNYRIGQYSATGAIPGPVGSGHSGFGQIPYGAYECKDGTYIAIAAGGQVHWSAFIRVLGFPELEKDPRFLTNAKRQQNANIITGLIDGMLLTKTASEWERIFFEAGVPVGVVNNISQAIAHPQVLHRNMVVNIKQPTGEDWKFAGNPIKMRGYTESYKAAPALGGNTAEILSDILGYSMEHLNELKKANVIWSEKNE